MCKYEPLWDWIKEFGIRNIRMPNLLLLNKLSWNCPIFDGQLNYFFAIFFRAAGSLG